MPQNSRGVIHLLSFKRRGGKPLRFETAVRDSHHGDGRVRDECVDLHGRILRKPQLVDGGAICWTLSSMQECLGPGFPSPVHSCHLHLLWSHQPVLGTGVVPATHTMSGHPKPSGAGIPPPISRYSSLSSSPPT